MKTVRVYDGALWCSKCNECPVVDHVPGEGAVVIHDPAKPENGRMRMTVAEFNAMIAHAKPIA